LNYLGIDVAKCKLDCVIISGGKASKCKTFDNTPKGFSALLSWIHQICKDDVRIAMEATGSYHEAAAEFLADQGLYVSVVNPALVKRYSECSGIRNSVDSVSAYVIADFWRVKTPRQWTPPSPEVRELRELTRRLNSLEQSKLEESNKLEAGPRSKAVIKSIKRVSALYTKEIQSAEELIKSHIEAHPGLKAKHELLDSIPGIGYKTAAIILAELPSIENLEHAKQVAAYAGLSPRQHRSGTSVIGKTRICKVGNSRLRAALYFPAMSAVRSNPILKAFYLRLLAAGKCKMSALCAVMRKLLHIVYGVLRHGVKFGQTTKAGDDEHNPPTPHSPDVAVGGAAVKARNDHRLGLGSSASGCYNPQRGGGTALPNPV
jgi:transposase